MTVLVLHRSGPVPAFAQYISELLRSEGFADHQLVHWDELRDTSDPAGLLAASDGFLLCSSPVSRAEIAAVRAAVTAGGACVALSPGWTLAAGLGLLPTGRSRSGLRLHLTDPSLAKLAPRGVQIPTPVQELTAGPEWSNTRVIARSGPGPDDPVVAITGQLGAGRITVLGVNIPVAVGRIRHGDPAATGILANGVLPYRCTDAMVAQTPPDLAKVPQADVLVRLLASAVVECCPRVARWWYYPQADQYTVGVQDSDDDWSTPEQFAQLLDAADEFGFQLSMYLMLGGQPTRLTDDQVAELARRGHSFGIHHDALPEWEDGEDQQLVIADIVRRDTTEFERRFGRTPLVNRNHCLVWWGRTDMARLQADLGLGMEFNAQGPADYWLGYVAGSLRPVRHVDDDGEVVDVFQQPTLVYDDESLRAMLGEDALAQAAAVLAWVDDQDDGGHFPLTMQSHPVSFAQYSAAFFRTVWSGLRDRGITIYSAEQWYRQTSDRDASTIKRVDDLTIQVVARGEHTQVLAVRAQPEERVHIDGEPAMGRPRVWDGATWLMVELTANPRGEEHTVSFVR